NSGEIRAKLVDIWGREVRRIDRITESEFLLERGHLNDGTYFLQVIQQNQTIAIQKIIFQ
ncbi:MAG: T9SS type A sorting domain-containing protein, partial [Simkaniaceae bacterium]|nr:T9SS type A sorting domain-containing protein [Simkaniaceae bacterium]